MKKIFSCLENYKKETVLAPLFKMAEALLELFVPVVIKLIIDNGIGGNDRNYIIKMCILLIFIAFAGLAFSITAQYFAAKAAAGFSCTLRDRLFMHIGTFSYTEIDSWGTSTLISRMTSDVNQLQNGINLTLRLLLRSPFVVFGAMIMAFTVDKKSALIFAGTIPVLAAVIFSLMLLSLPLYNKVQKNLDRVMMKARSTLTGVRVLRAFGTEEKDIKDFSDRNNSLRQSVIKSGRVSALLNPLTYVLINIAAAILIYTGALQVDGGIISRGAVVALYNYMAQILVELIKLANLIISITKAWAGAKRINSVFETESSMHYPEKSAEPDFSAPAVKFEGVSLTYKNAGEKSLDGISFTVKKGETAGIIGSTGSGKTSVVNLIMRFYDRDSGSIEIFGHDIKEYSKEKLCSLISLAAQKAVLFSGTIKDNILWGRENATDEEIKAAVNAAQAQDIIESKGIDAEIEEGGKNLSGGQKQRISLARAIIKNAPVLILDDASSALDPGTDLRLRRSVSSLESRPAVIIVSQRISSVMNCDKIIVTDDGRITAEGTHEELLLKSPVYKEIYDSQKGGADNG